MPTQSQTETAPIVKSAQDLYEIVKGDVIAAAEIMPESGYSLKIDPNVRRRQRAEREADHRAGP